MVTIAHSKNNMKNPKATLTIKELKDIKNMLDKMVEEQANKRAEAIDKAIINNVPGWKLWLCKKVKSKFIYKITNTNIIFYEVPLLGKSLVYYNKKLILEYTIKAEYTKK